MLKREDLIKFAPRPASGDKAANWDAYAKALAEHGGALAAEFGIDTALELQHFMAQIAHESGGFTILWEDMRYRAERIIEIFGVGHHSAKIGSREAHELANNPKALAERVYGLGNPRKARELGNTEAGDGYNFRGFGPMQVTGRADHERLLHGDKSAYGALRSAFAEWSEKNCNELAARDDIKSITKRINGGYNGFESRKRYLAKAMRIWPLFPGADSPKMTVAEAKIVSSKASAAGAAQNIAKAAVVAGGVLEASDPIAKWTDQLTGFNGLASAISTAAAFTKDHIGVAVVLGAIGLWWFGRHIIRRVIADYSSGRYMPEIKS